MPGDAHHGLHGSALPGDGVTAPARPETDLESSASVPIGLYSVTPTSTHRVGDLVLVKPPEALAAFLDARGYLPRGVPLLKHIAALPGHDVCRIAGTITVN